VSRRAQGIGRAADEGNVSDVLSQGEIDALLAAIAAGDVDAGSLTERVDGPQVRPFDFRRPNKFAREQLRTLEMLHENFCRQASTELSAQLQSSSRSRSSGRSRSPTASSSTRCRCRR
jgi:flagellar motor switch protein FliM